MKLYCENCGLQLKVTRKALPKLGIIVDLVSYHVCSEEPIPFSLGSSEILEAAPIEGKTKFVKSLNELSPSKIMSTETFEPRRSMMTGTDDLRDRRFDRDEKPISSAPPTVLDQIRSMSNSIPSHDVKDNELDSEMGG